MDATRRTSGRDWRVKINNRISTDCFIECDSSKSVQSRGVFQTDLTLRSNERTRRRNGNARERGWSSTREATRRDSERSDDGNDEENNRTKRTARKTSQSYLSYHRNASTVLTLRAPRNQSKSINPRANQETNQSAGASPSLDTRASERSTTTRERCARLSPASFGDGTTREGFVVGDSGRERLCRATVRARAVSSERANDD